MDSSSPSSPEVSTSEAQPVFSYKTATQEEVLEDLSSRFILNLPDEEFDSLERLCFQVEQAHWFYEDFIREQNTKLPSLPLKKFSEMLFRACPLLHHWSDDHEKAFNQFMQYKTRVPVCGAIMLNDTMDKCVLVKGWKASSGWGFPKGKINETEPPPACAIREVLEETGYNLAGQLNPQDVIELSIKEQKISLFIVPGVPEDFPFETRTRKEISKIEWFRVADLPTWKKSKTAIGRFYLISPFIAPLKSFINQRRPRNQRKGAKSRKVQNSAPEVPAHDYGVQDSEAEQDLNNGNRDRTPRPNEVEAPTDMSNMDPQLARLLSSLTLSAQSNGNGNASERRAADSIATPQTSVTTNQNGRDSGSFASEGAESHGQADWSSSVPPPPPSEEALLRSPEYLVSAHGRQHASQSSTSPPSSQPTPRYDSNTVESNETMSSSAVSATLPAPSSSLRSPNIPAATTDISPPYLVRAEVPSLTKELQARSLLESVAVESEKMAHVMASTTPTNNPDLVPMPPHLRPGPYHSQSVPDSLPDLGILYTSNDGGRALATANGFRPAPVPQMAQGFFDPHGRSRTSHAMLRNPVHNVTGSVNFNQNQQSLLAAINGPRSPPLEVQYPLGPPPRFVNQPPPPPSLPLHAFNAGAPYYPPLHNPRFVAPMPPMNQSFGPAMQPDPRMMPLPQHNVRPFSALGPGPIPTSGSEASQQAAATLLSILNGPRQPTTAPAPVPQY